jgi:tight adherence protein B
VIDEARQAKRRGACFGRRARLSDDDVATWCDDLARLVRSGSSLAAALRSATPALTLAPIVAPIGLALDRGDTVAGATRRVDSSDPSVDLALAVIRACADLGGPAAQPLDRTASTLRARAADLAERQVHSAQARLSAVVLTLLPGAALGVLLATSGDARAAVIGPAGAICLGAGAALNAIGWWWMRRIIGSTP